MDISRHFWTFLWSRFFANLSIPRIEVRNRLDLLIIISRKKNRKVAEEASVVPERLVAERTPDKIDRALAGPWTHRPPWLEQCVGDQLNKHSTATFHSRIGNTPRIVSSLTLNLSFSSVSEFLWFWHYDSWTYLQNSPRQHRDSLLCPSSLANFQQQRQLTATAQHRARSYYLHTENHTTLLYNQIRVTLPIMPRK